MPKETKVCLSCKERPPRQLRCAANWALLWSWSGFDDDELRRHGLIPDREDESEGDDDDD